jgi:peroxiredoxin
MFRKISFTLFFIVFLFDGKSQEKKIYFKLKFSNQSSFVNYCNIAGNDKTDSVLPGRTKLIDFEIAQDDISFYLNVWTKDTMRGSFRHKSIRVLDTKRIREITITKGSQLKMALTPSEVIIAEYNPRLRSKNFWKMDTVIRRYAGSSAAAEIIYLSLCDIDVPVDTIQRFYNMLRPQIRLNEYGKRITDYVVARSRLNAGTKVDNFALPDTSGKTFELGEIKSDYILLDFWFSSCVPCIKSFPALRELYNKTGRKELEILGISIDPVSENDQWKGTIRKLELLWPNLRDVKYAVTKKFAIVNYPTKILVNKDRVIVLVDTHNSYENFYQEVEKLIHNQ